jgi:hypothetical protein
MQAIVNSMAIVDNTIVRFISLLFVRKDTKFWEIKYKRIPFLCSYTQNFVSLHTKWTGFNGASTLSPAFSCMDSRLQYGSRDHTDRKI